MNFAGIDASLKDGCKIHAFRSGGGLRVIRIEKGDALKGYGEYLEIEGALADANEDFLAGHREYSEVYAGSKSHYLTGSYTSTSDLDLWILKGRTFDAWQEGENVVFQLNGSSTLMVPIIKMGRGENFAEAMENAMEAEEVEVECS